MRIRENGAALCQAIHVRRLHLRMSAERLYPVIEIIDGDEENVRFLRSGAAPESQPENEKAKKACDHAPIPRINGSSVNRWTRSFAILWPRPIALVVSMPEVSSLHPNRTRLRRWHWGMVIFVAGYHAFQNIWLHLIWFAVAVAWPYSRFQRPAKFPPFLIAAAVFSAVMLILSFRPGLPGSELGLLGIPLAIVDSLLFLLFLDASYRLGRRRERFSRQALAISVLVAGATSALSLTIFYALPKNTFPASRLENVIVHFGMAPVLTGMLFAAAALAAAVLACQETCPKKRRYWLGLEALLLFAALCAQSRGAMLAFAIGFLVLVVCQFGRRLLSPVVILVLVVVIYQWAIPALTASPTQPGLRNPAKSMVVRKDAGRLQLYQIILSRMEPPADYLFGRGRWANDVVKPPEQHWHAHHPHSAYLGTFYRGGAIGLFTLSVVLGMGLLACVREARAGRPARSGKFCRSLCRENPAVAHSHIGEWSWRCQPDPESGQLCGS